MYEKIPETIAQAINQRAVTSAAPEWNRQLQGVSGQIGGAAAQVRDKPMLDVEFDQLAQAAAELDQSVQWLIERIQPICQPCIAGKAIEGNSCEEPASPSSEMRTKLKNLRGLVESTSRRIAEVRFTIEV